MVFPSKPPFYRRMSEMFPEFSHDFPTIFPGFSYDFPCSHVFPMFFPCFPHVFPMFFPWFAGGALQLFPFPSALTGTAGRGLHASIIGRALGRSFANVCGGPQGPQGEGEIQGDRTVPSCSIYVYYIVYK